MLFFAIPVMVLSGFHGRMPASSHRASRVFELPGPVNARRRDARPASPEYALAAPGPEIESPRAEGERDPCPWPRQVLQGASQSAGATFRLGGPVASLPHGLPPPLARTCVLRI
jgi:hypothetical protein